MRGHQTRRYEPGYESRDCGFDTPCWIWTGCIGAGGYGIDGGRYAHVIAYGKPVPAGHHVHHRCEQRACVNPTHLEAIKASEHRRRHRKFPPELVEEVRRATGSTRQIARQFGISKSHVALLRSDLSR